MSGFHPHWRQRALGGLDQPFDLLVIGGGITGCGVLLDAAQRGMRVLLIEKGDVAWGTSSRSSKLIHGGLRYLKQMQLRITRIACRERDRLLAASPHLVAPIEFVYPAYEGASTPGWQVDLGLWMYDRLTRRPQKHSHLDEEEVQEAAPGLATAGLDRALQFVDAVADDARLTLAVAATGAAYGGLVLTRAEVEDALRDADGRLVGVVLRDLESGRTHRATAAVVVNATGHWVDQLRERFGLTGARLRPSRGVHLIFPARLLPLQSAVVAASPDDGRPVFVIPHPEGVLVGTTDLFHDGSLDDPRPSVEEVEYLLRVVAAAFPQRRVRREDVLGAFAGLRPILHSHAETPSAASREEDIWEEGGLLSVAGGKLTTYRVTAEMVVDQVVERLSAARAAQLGPCLTVGTPLHGLAPADLSARLQAAAEVDEPVAAALARRLGAAAWTALAMARDRRELRPIVDGCDLCAAEVRAHLRHGGVVRLEDLLLRRTRIGMWDPPLARDLAGRLRPWFAAELGWRGRRWQLEEERFAAAQAAWAPEGIA